MKKIFLVACLFAVSHATFSWGVTGHRTTGKVADKYLNKKARKALEKILGGHSIAILTTWMDEIRSDSVYDYTADWHWVTVQDGQTYDQAVKNPHGDVIQTLERIIGELKSHKLSEKEELERLKFLFHLVGDIHQPLHVGGGNDKGGNDVKVSWFRTDSNLHRVWDSEMIDDTKLSYTELAESLDIPTEIQVQQWQKASVRDWANESMTFRKDVYSIGNGKLGYAYSYKNFHIVRLRLLQAGVRMAGILNEIYGQ